MQLPEFLQPYKEEAKNYLVENLVKKLEFSGGTYQVQVEDSHSHHDCWVFLQLNSRGLIKDSFCSCNEHEEIEEEIEGNEEEVQELPVKPCVHIAAAFLRIYNTNPEPLHLRFKKSLWNQICRLYADRFSGNASILNKVSPGHYSITSNSGKLIFFVKGKTDPIITYLKEIIENRKKETEETSLKFSNLSLEELTKWREGKPSDQLKYELSFWNDFAHWLMRLQDEGQEYTINFQLSPEKIPKFLKINFPKLEFGFYLSSAYLPVIIPTLSTVKSPLVVHNLLPDLIQGITFDKTTGELCVEAKSISEGNFPDEAKGEKRFSIDGWWYVPDDGFYAKNPHHFLEDPIIKGKEISRTLNEHLHMIRPLLQGVALHTEPLKVSYDLAFDSQWNLHLTAYAFTKGDLTGPFSHYFGDWAYIDGKGKGFYRLDGLRFGQIEKIIPANAVADFVRQELVWFNLQEGFQTHVASLETQLTYSIDTDNRLVFRRKLDLKEKSVKTKDFGIWVYVSGEGFYSKISQQTVLSIRPDLSISSDQIPLFIRIHHDDLLTIPNFFSKKSHIKNFGIKIDLSANNEILINPDYEIDSEFQKKKVRFFDNFSFVEGDGFYEIPINKLLPERFRYSQIIQAKDHTSFITTELETLKPFITEIDPRLISPTTLKLIATGILRELSLGEGGYALKLAYQSEQGVIPVAEMWAAIKQKKQFLFSAAGMIDLSSKRFDWIRLLSKNRVDKKSNVLLMTTLEVIRLNALDEIQIKADSQTEQELSQALLHQLTDFVTPEPPNLYGLNSQLRPYQEYGLHWLWFLYKQNLSGLLCDDMGLGKTHQAMALLAAIRNSREKKEDRSNIHFLIICPTSVIYHWQEKIEAFLPGIRVCTFHGNNRSLEDFHNQYDVLLTSYSIWRIENKLLSAVTFEVAIFDEIQIAKNHNSRIHLSLLTVQSKMRLGLTGTPIENRLRELKALFDIVLPGYMPADKDYRELFVKPIEKESDYDRRGLLTRFIKPFLLRRKKEDVLLDLPEKTEEIAHCVLLPEQESLYTSALQQSRDRLVDQLQDKSSPIPYIHVFALLSHLKQICNHPAVYLKSPWEYKNYSSGKWELFQELLEEARESQQKVVVFTQYLMMLDIFQEYLQESGIEFATIRGATMDRGEQIQRFNNDPKCEVFLGSLQAAGLGIDLTAASVVIHYDRWWNAARENQATDRVHRIGQTRGVQVFKLVTKGTFEEKIDLLISKKGRLMEEIVGVDDHNIVKQFNREELIQLLQYVENEK